VQIFVEFSHEDGLILLLSKTILIFCSLTAALLSVVIIGFYVFDVFVLPTRTIEVLMDWYLPHYAKFNLQKWISFITDLVSQGLGCFLGITNISSYCFILNFFITDSIRKLKQWVYINQFRIPQNLGILINLFVIAYSSLETTRATNVSEIDKLIKAYSSLQILERMYNNYYRSVIWPALVQLGTLAIFVPLSLCLSKWHMISKDPRVLMLFISILQGFIGCVFAPYFASKVNTTSRLFLRYQCRAFSSTYLRKRISSKPILSIKISDNFMDVQFPLTVLMFCFNNVFSLLIIFKQSQ